MVFKIEERKMIDLGKTLKTLNLAFAEKIWRDDWNLSQKSFLQDKLFFLSSNFVLNSCQKLHMPREITEEFLQALSMFKGNEALQRLVWHCHFLLFQSSKDQTGKIGSWSMISKDIAF